MYKELEKDTYGNYIIKISKYQAQTILDFISSMSQEEISKLKIGEVIELNSLTITLEEVVNGKFDKNY